MASKSLEKKSSPGAIMLRAIIGKFDALRYLPKLANGFLKFNAAGNLVADQDMVLSGIVVESVDSRSGAGAISLTTGVTKFTSTDAAQALTLADGVEGQIKRIVHVVDGGSGVLTPATKTGFTTITFTAAGDAATLQFFAARGWMIVSLNGAVAA